MCFEDLRVWGQGDAMQTGKMLIIAKPEWWADYSLYFSLQVFVYLKKFYDLKS